MKETLIFDCDGVLVDSEIIAEAALAEQLKGWLPDLPSQLLLRDTLGRTTENILQHFESLSRHVLPHNALARVDRAIDFRLKNELRAIDGVADVIFRVTLPLAIVSNSHRKRVVDSLAVTGLDSLLRRAPVFTAQQVAHPKPDPAIYRFAASVLSCRPANCLVVEDSVAGVTSARSADMTVIGFAGASHIEDRNCHGERLLRAGAWKTLDAMKGLESLVEEWRHQREGSKDKKSRV